MYLYIVLLIFEHERMVRTKTGRPMKNEKLEYSRISMKHQLMKKLLVIPNYSAKTIEIVLENLHKDLKISKKFQKFSIKFKKNKEKILENLKFFY